LLLDTSGRAALRLLACCLAATVARANTALSVSSIIQKSVEANNVDFRAAPEFSSRELDRIAAGTKTWEDLMIDGSPYQRLIAVNGEPLSKEQSEAEERKLQQTVASRKAESTSQRQQRIARYEKGRKRDRAMMQQLTAAFNFKLIGKRTVNSREVYMLRATPKPGYQPPNMETQVLPGMQGELWIDTETFQWVKVTAKVIRPVSIEGFLAEVEPGTQFELEKMPVADGIWLPKHFSMKSHAKVLYVFHHSSSDDETYSDYKRIGDASK
jgi:hypothetical protein